MTVHSHGTHARVSSSEQPDVFAILASCALRCELVRAQNIQRRLISEVLHFPQMFPKAVLLRDLLKPRWSRVVVFQRQHEPVHCFRKSFASGGPNAFPPRAADTGRCTMVANVQALAQTSCATAASVGRLVKATSFAGNSS